MIYMLHKPGKEDRLIRCFSISLCQLLARFFEEINESVWARLDSRGVASWPRAKRFNLLHFNYCPTQLGTAAATNHVFQLTHDWKVLEQGTSTLVTSCCWASEGAGAFKMGMHLAEAVWFVQSSVSKCKTGMANMANDAEINDFSVIISCPISERMTELVCNRIPNADTEFQGLN